MSYLPSVRWASRTVGPSMLTASITGARRSTDWSSASAYRRRTSSCGGAPAWADAMRRSSMVSSRLQGLKSTLPTVTVRPSFSLAIFCSWLLAIGGTASQSTSHSTSSDAKATIPRRTHLFCFSQAAFFITAECARSTRPFPPMKKPDGQTVKSCHRA